jgi:hypothetical protein
LQFMLTELASTPAYVLYVLCPQVIQVLSILFGCYMHSHPCNICHCSCSVISERGSRLITEFCHRKEPHLLTKLNPFRRGLKLGVIFGQLWSTSLTGSGNNAWAWAVLSLITWLWCIYLCLTVTEEQAVFLARRAPLWKTRKVRQKIEILSGWVVQGTTWLITTSFSVKGIKKSNVAGSQSL